MFDSHHNNVFSVQANGYQMAMTSCAEARRQEFEHAAACLDVMPGCTICDVPARGGYLSDYVSVLANFLFLETSASFADQCTRDERHQVRQAASLEQLPVANESVQRLLSLGAMHHVADKQRALREFGRLLTPGGIGVIADVEINTGSASFLNKFVNQYKSTGHKGAFLDDSFYQSIERAGLVLREVQRPDLQWRFDSVDDMTLFCIRIFGLDLATRDDVLRGIKKYLGYTDLADGVFMNWQLSYSVVEKPR